MDMKRDKLPEQMRWLPDDIQPKFDTSGIEQIMLGGIRCVKVKDAITGVIVYRARGKIHPNCIVPMEAKNEEFRNLSEWVIFVSKHFKYDWL